MVLTETELKILQLKKQGLSDYKISRFLKMHPPDVTRSRNNAHKKLLQAIKEIKSLKEQEIGICGYAESPKKDKLPTYRFYL